MGIVTLSMFIVMLELLLPAGNIKKAVNLVSGFIMIIVVINPFIGLFGKNLNLIDFQTSNSNFLDKKELSYKGKMLEEVKMRQTIEVYREKIMEQAENAARSIKGVFDVKADVLIDEDLNSESFGNIERIYLYILTGNDELYGSSTIKIERIKIDSNKDNVRDETSEFDKKIRSEIENRIQDLLNVDKQSIIISFEKE